MAKFYAQNSEGKVVEFNRIKTLEEFTDFLLGAEEKSNYNFMVEFEFYAEIDGKTYILEAGDWYPVE